MVSLDDLAVKAEKIIADYLDISPDKVTADSTLADFNVDSLETIAIIMMLENETAIAVPNDALGSIETVQDLATLFYKCQKELPTDTEFSSFN